MLYVYLDQNKWVDLSLGFESGDDVGEKFRDVSQSALRSANAGLASFPLSSAHIFETWKRRKWQPRHRLASTMIKVSGLDAIAAPHSLLPPELDRALNRRFGKPATLLPLEPFGHGLMHAGGAAAVQLLDESRTEIRTMLGVDSADADDLIDAVLLAGPKEDLPVAGIGQPPLQFGQGFAQDQNAQADLFKQHNADKATRRNAVAFLALQDIKLPITEALVRAQLTWDDLMQFDAEAMTAFLQDLPSRTAGLEIMWRQYDDLNIEWKANDLNDIGYLSTAVAYCDVVVTERKWAHVLNASGASAVAGTTVLHDLVELKPLLDGLSPAA